MASTFVCNFYKHFKNVTDVRVDRGRNYPLIEMMFLTLCATLCDANCWTDVERFGNSKLKWLRKFMKFESGIPSHDTLGRVFSRLDSIEFYAALQSWAMEIARSLRGQTVALDGKALRRSHDKALGKSALHSVSAWVCGLKMCVGLKSVDDKSNEIPAVQELIEMLDLEGATVTADAMHCQRETAQAIINKGADYILMAKGNQASLQTELFERIVEAFDSDEFKVKTSTKTEKNRDRTETREMAVVPVPKNSAVFARWPGIKTIGSIFRRRELGDTVDEHHEVFISSRTGSASSFQKQIRSHWGIENSQHYILDVTFAEDASRIRKGTGPEISSAFRRLALTILQRDTSVKDTIRGKRKRCAWDETVMERIIAEFHGV